MIAAFDVGNTKTALGLYERGKRVYDWTVQTDVNQTADAFAMLIRQLFQHHGLKLENVRGVMISSVVPAFDETLRDMCTRYFDLPPKTVGPGIKTGLNIMSDNPKEVGSDRIVNAVSALQKYQAPLIIVDFGTASTYCYINKKSQYMGGVIAPGMEISMQALYNKASKLPTVDTVKTDKVIGTNTVDAMRSGYLFGVISQAEGIIGKIKAEADDASPLVIATGDQAEMIAENTASIDKVEPYLTLDGLCYIYEKNEKGE
ncbi:type III pantothenate kinase [Salisediminibacterium halotolerans]|uniref:Type III pantothenate kinase n=1 Tax=Salisediminibacterium halotolerans TaxID=517425 RepID=A0A1H9VTA6_9BACI|nr:type III pantothenate kinase [Salisediminibacterium haloalkalitolerans]SES24617.1 type III pantothenate kinase [Salisediminibacterium haloalkalitolerans]